MAYHHLPPPTAMRRTQSDGASRYGNERRYHPMHAYTFNDPHDPLSIPREYKYHSRSGLAYSQEEERLQERMYLEERVAQTNKIVAQLERDTEELQLDVHMGEMERQTSLSGVDEVNRELQRTAATTVQMRQNLEQKARLCKEQYSGLAQDTNIAPQIRQHAELKQTVDVLSNKNDALKAMIEITEKDLNKRVMILNRQMKKEKEIADDTERHNMALKLEIDELRQEKEALEAELKQGPESQNLQPNPALVRTDGAGDDSPFAEYPSEATVIANLLQAQVEYCFSDHNLKRDRRLLDEICDKDGFLTIERLMVLPKIRQLCDDPLTLLEAVSRSTILTVKEGSPKMQEDGVQEAGDVDVKGQEDDEEDEETAATRRMLVGREAFERPPEKEFPFRRTVFLFGVNPDWTEDDLRRMLRCFGECDKVVLDKPNSIDREIGKTFLNQPRTYTLFSQRSRFPMELRVDDSSVDNMIKCTGKCKKQKPGHEGYYECEALNEILCMQCAALHAEEQLAAFRNNHGHGRDPRRYIGDVPDKSVQDRARTALVVFSSQRQASRCFYTRSRIGDNGMFAANFHNYSKARRELEQADGGAEKVHRTRRNGRHNGVEKQKGRSRGGRGRGRGRGWTTRR